MYTGNGEADTAIEQAVAVGKGIKVIGAWCVYVTMRVLSVCDPVEYVQYIHGNISCSSEPTAVNRQSCIVLELYYLDCNKI